MFIWRLLKGIVPTKGALRRRAVPTHLECVFCQGAEEDDLHVFKDCGIVSSFWALSDLGQMATRVSAVSLDDWIKNGFLNAPNVTEWGVKYLHDYQQVHLHVKIKNRRAGAKWKNPPSGTLKVNVDGSYRSELGDSGIGVVVCDEQGTCLAVMARYFPKVLSTFHMEAESFKASLLLAIYQGWDEFEIESDCSLMVAALTQNAEDRSDVGCIIDDCKSYMASLHSIRFLMSLEKQMV
ncbi:uncharacterized protein LOC133744542 [Rosa rugosa]|uniref:uncharacterized protein LOC133744542 n=1 Tax=Rosa rugosa TaxID=74645 RepID=UPI002B4159A6|nr:uncharacterized protein LOC133744542 [Rosa rugosa]